MLSALKNFGITLGAGLIIFGLLAMGITNFAVKNFNDGFTKKVSTPAEEQNADSDTAVSTKIDLSGVQGQSFTALLVGVDYLPDAIGDYASTFSEDYQKSANQILYSADSVPQSLCTFVKKRNVSADAIVLFHVNREEQSFIIYSIPYNTRILIDGNYTQLGNLIHLKGMSFFVQKIQALTGMTIDYHMVFTPKGFTNIMQSLGQITFEVPCNMNYSDAGQGLSINVTAGEQKLGGQDLLKVLRYNSYSDGDVSRMTTIRSFITTMLSQMETLTTLDKSADLYAKMLAYIYTNMDAAAFASVADLVYCYKDFTCISQTYPGAEITYDGENYFDPDIVEATEFLKTYR